MPMSLTQATACSHAGDLLCPDPVMGPLHFACWHGQQDQVTKLLDNFDNDIHESGLFGLSSLHIAALRGHAHIVHTLLQHGAEPGWSDPGLNVKEFVDTVRPSFWRELLPNVSATHTDACTHTHTHTHLQFHIPSYAIHSYVHVSFGGV